MNWFTRRHAKPPHHAVDVGGVGEVGPAGLLEDFAVSVAEHREDQPHHLFVVDWLAIERP
jgi:hypothetical protein